MKRIFGICLALLGLVAQASDLFLEGRLLDTTGKPIVKATFTAEAFVYAAATGETGRQKVESIAADRFFTDADGYYAFHVRNLDLAAYLRQHSEAWLGLEQVQNTATGKTVADLPPRQRVGSVPYALVADHATRLTEGAVLNRDEAKDYSLTVTNDLIASKLLFDGDVGDLDLTKGGGAILGHPMTGLRNFKDADGKIQRKGKVRSFNFRESAGYDGFENSFDYIWHAVGTNDVRIKAQRIVVDQDCLVRVNFITSGGRGNKDLEIEVYESEENTKKGYSGRLFYVGPGSAGSWDVVNTAPPTQNEPPLGIGHMAVFPMRAGYVMNIWSDWHKSSYPSGSYDSVWMGVEIIPFGLETTGN